MTKKILAIEYACEPNRGSEPGVGWNWSKIISETPGYEITVVTRANNKPVIDEYKKEHPELKVKFEYYDLPDWILKFKNKDKAIVFFFTLWQKGVIKFIKKNINLDDYDLIWDFNFGSLNLPVYTYKLKKNYIVGPVSTKKKVPSDYIKQTGPIQKTKYVLKQFIKEHLRLNPSSWKTLKRADKILLCNKIYREYLPVHQQEKAEVVFHNGIDVKEDVSFPVEEKKDTFKFIFAGRLIDSKNLDIAIKALKIIKDKGIDFSYKIVGDGPLRNKLIKLTEKLELENNIEFISRMKQSELFEEYLNNDYFLFPSILEISSTSVMEAMYFGLEPICFDIMGMNYVLDNAPVCKLPIKSPKDDIDQIVNCITELSQNKKVESKQELNEFAKKHYTWESREKDIRDILRKMV